MSRLKLIGAALLLVVFDTYTASADPRIAPAAESAVTSSAAGANAVSPIY